MLDSENVSALEASLSDEARKELKRRRQRGDWQALGPTEWFDRGCLRQ